MEETIPKNNNQEKLNRRIDSIQLAIIPLISLAHQIRFTKQTEPQLKTQNSKGLNLLLLLTCTDKINKMLKIFIQRVIQQFKNKVTQTNKQKKESLLCFKII